MFFKKTPSEILKENELLRQEITRTEKLKLISTFASGVAHEIKNPLTAIKTFCEYLPNKKNDSEFLDKFSRIVSKEVERIDNLVHQLLEFAKPSPLTLHSMDIHPLIEDTLNLLSSEFLKHKVNIQKNYTQQNILLSIDANQFRQAFLNVLLNAIEAMTNGGTLTIETKIKEESFPFRSPIHFFQIIIRDTGCGISPEHLPHIFDPFFTKKDHGTGLGLSITHQIIKEHGGKIKVDSQINQGTIFVVELPWEIK